MKPIANSMAFHRYRQQLPGLLAGRDERFFAQILNEEMRVFATVGVWAARYAARGNAIGRQLADIAAAESLIARNRARDAAEPMPLEWPLSLQAQISQTMVVTRTGGETVDVSLPSEAHGYGPSLRALWNQAKRAGLDEAGAWQHIRDWAIGPIGLAQAPESSDDLVWRLGKEMRWSKTDDLDSPWSTTIGTAESTQHWRIRLNDFPEQPMYRLEVDGKPVGDFNDWPETWHVDDELRATEQPARPRASSSPIAIAGAAARQWLDRYQAGQHEPVWDEMRSLGPDIRKRAYKASAWAVARETMRRARHNIELIIRRLDAMGYQFWDGEQGSLGPKGLRISFGGQVLEFPSAEAAAQDALRIDPSRIPSPGMRKHVEAAHERLSSLLGVFMQMQEGISKRRQQRARITDHLTDPIVFAPADPEDIAFVRKVEKRGLVLPLSLRAWVEEVGHVNLSGSHPALCSWEGANFAGVYADPLSVFLDHFMMEAEGWLEEGDETASIFPVIGWDAATKARLAVVDEQLDFGYTMALPDPSADAPLRDAPHDATFVNHLRIAFRWGGFPGWENQPKRPESELEKLTAGLLPI